MTAPFRKAFGFTSTADEVLAGVDLSGTRAVVTGATSGVGVETSLALARAGAAVVLGVRNVDAGKETAARISEATGNADIGVARLDLADLGSVHIATNLQKHTGGLQTPRERRKNPAQGAATSVLLAASPLLDGVGGRYFEDCNEAPVLEERPAMFGGGVAPFALDPANAERLWTVATEVMS